MKDRLTAYIPAIILLAVGIAIIYQSPSCLNEQIQERLDEITQQNEYIMNALNDK